MNQGVPEAGLRCVGVTAKQPIWTLMNKAFFSIALPPPIFCFPRGFLVRHLVLPEGSAGTREAMCFLAEDISRDGYANIVAQYYPCGDIIPPDPPLTRRTTRKEFLEAIRIAHDEGLNRIDGEF